MLPPPWQKVVLALMRPSGYVHADAVAEVMDSFEYAFRALGAEVERTENKVDGRTGIVFCGHFVPEALVGNLPPNLIVYNLEQLSGGSPFVTPAYLKLLERYPVWDYSVRNIAALRALFPGKAAVRHVPIGFVSELTRIPKQPNEDIDVLFYGSLNDRRRYVLDALRETGLAVHHAFGVYGQTRDALIARAKVVLNMHFYPSQVFEIVRVSYLLANSKAVVSEGGPDTEIDQDLVDAVALASYDQLTTTCQALIADSARRHRLGSDGYNIFSRRDLKDTLKRAIAA